MRIEDIRTVHDGETVSVANTGATLLAGKQKNRTCLLIQNTHSSNALKVGSQNAITGGTHLSIPAGGVYTYYGAAPIYAQAASGTINVRVIPITGAPNRLGTSTHSQLSITSARSLILPRNRKRVWAAISNIGASAITVGSRHVRYGSMGIDIPAGGLVVLPGGGELWAINTGTNEVQEIAFSGTIEEGTFTLSLDGYSWTFAHDVAAEDVEEALESHPLIGPGNVTVAADTGKLVITFVGELAATDVPELELEADVSGENADISISTKTEGDSATAVTLNIREEKIG